MCVQSKRGKRDGNDTESADEQTGSPLHVLSDMAQKEGELAARPGAAANGPDSAASPRMQTRSGGQAAAGEARSAPSPLANPPLLPLLASSCSLFLSFSSGRIACSLCISG